LLKRIELNQDDAISPIVVQHNALPPKQKKQAPIAELPARPRSEAPVPKIQEAIKNWRHCGLPCANANDRF
jgi:hypothetical protein